MNTLTVAVLKRRGMATRTSDMVPLSKARSRFSVIADEAKARAEEIITKNGDNYVALIDADKLDYYCRIERAPAA